MFVVRFEIVFGVGEVQMTMVDSRRNHIPFSDLQMNGRVVVDEMGSDMMIDWMNGVKIELLVIVGVIVVEFVDVVVGFEVVEVLVVVVAVAAVAVAVVVVAVVVVDEVEEPLVAGMAAVEC